jgi:DNA-binding NtrC family response regulator
MSSHETSSNQNRLHPPQGIDPQDEPRLLSTKARYLKELTLAFLAAVETLGTDRHLDIDHGLSLREEVRRFEVDLIKYALQRTGGNQTRAAALLGVKATTLNSKVKLYHLQTEIFRSHFKRRG